jgi:hypothetical protein
VLGHVAQLDVPCPFLSFCSKWKVLERQESDGIGRETWLCTCGEFGWVDFIRLALAVMQSRVTVRQTHRVSYRNVSRWHDNDMP